MSLSAYKGFESDPSNQSDFEYMTSDTVIKQNFSRNVSFLGLRKNFQNWTDEIEKAGGEERSAGYIMSLFKSGNFFDSLTNLENGRLLDVLGHQELAFSFYKKALEDEGDKRQARELISILELHSNNIVAADLMAMHANQDYPITKVVLKVLQEKYKTK